FDFHAGIGVIADDFDHARDRLSVFQRLGDDLHHHHLARLRAVRLVGRHQDFVTDALVFRRDVKDAVFAVQAPDQPLLPALEHFNDGAFRPPAAVGAGDAGHHAVAVHHFAHFLRPEEQVLPALVAHEETETV